MRSVPNSAAGLLVLLVLLSSGSSDVSGQATSPDSLRDTFQRRAKLQRHVAQMKQRSLWPLRQRSRRSQIGLRVDKNETFVLEKTPPGLVHPNRFDYTDAQDVAREIGQFDPNNNSFVSTVPIVDSSNGTSFFRSGRTSTASDRKRMVNPLVTRDMELGGASNGDVQEFKVYYVVPVPASSSDGAELQKGEERGSFSSSGGLLQVQPAPTLRARDGEAQHFFEAAKQPGPTPAATWNGQPSKFRPKTPYQPSANSTADYGDVISKSLWFYQEQRSGLLMNSPRPIPWRNDSGLKDGFDNNIDLTGGYYDAGDYLKFTFPLSSALTLLAWSGTDHWRGVSQSGNLGYWDETLRWGLDWMVKAHPSADTLYVQVGDGNVDNNYWGPDTSIPTPRPSFFVNGNSPGTDVAAGAATAFAAGAIFYASVAGDQQYAQSLLEHALSLYYFAESAQKTLYQVSVPAVKEWYASSDYSDELTLAGLLLYRATSNSYFLHRAETYFKKYQVGDNRDPTDWDSKHGLAMLLGAQLVQQNGVKSKVDWAGSLTTYLSETALKQGKTPGGLLYWPGTSDENSIPSTMGITWVMTEYARLFPNNTQSQAFRDLADTQIDYVFGKNPKGMPYVVGVSDKSPKNPQSAMASGGHDIGNIDHSPEKMLRVLYGGLVGGPAKDDSFQDKRSNYKQSECALDYNAPLTAIMAGEYERGKLPFFLRQ